MARNNKKEHSHTLFLTKGLDESGKKSVVHSHENATHFTISHPKKTSQ